MTSNKLLHVTALMCLLTESTRTKEHKPTTPIQVVITLTCIIKILKGQNT